MSKYDDMPVLHENVPKDGNRFSLAVGRWLWKKLGWQFAGELPPNKKIILAAGIHTSNWDFVIAMAAKLALGIHFSYLMKKEAFFWPLGGLFKRWGGVPIDRKNSQGLVDDINQWISARDKAWVAITPEGTRSKVGRWKTGFLRIAEAADIPVYLISWDYPTKTIHFLGEWPLTGDHEKDAEAMRQHLLDNYKGKHPDLH